MLKKTNKNYKIVNIKYKFMLNKIFSWNIDVCRINNNIINKNKISYKTTNKRKIIIWGKKCKIV